MQEAGQVDAEVFCVQEGTVLRGDLPVGGLGEAQEALQGHGGEEGGEGEEEKEENYSDRRGGS